jgi:hypothetical protein
MNGHETRPFLARNGLGECLPELLAACQHQQALQHPQLVVTLYSTEMRRAQGLPAQRSAKDEVRFNRFGLDPHLE